MSDDYRTPLAKVRGSGTAHSGTTHFRHQRLTAIANIPLMAFLLWLVLVLAGKPHNEVSECLATTWVSTLLILSLASMFYHMKLGMQVVIEDYVHGRLGRVLLLSNLFFCILLFTIGVMSIITNMGF